VGEWQWINRDEPFNYVNWAEGQPDNQKDNENRLQFYSTHGLDGRRPTWNDAPATFAARGFVVEYDTDASRAPPAALPTGSEQVLTAEQMAGIVLIEGDKGVATGFLAKIGDIEVVVTNLHVIGDNERLLVRTLGGNTVTWSGLIGAVGSDVALLRVAQPTGQESALALAEDVLKRAKIGDTVVVVGNRLGGGRCCLTE
jgi:S1-C subfamily serine protease